jgi:hypothetical protein
MISHKVILVFLMFYLAGCTGSNYTEQSHEDLIASYHMIIADSLAAKSSLRKATTEYLLITKQYPDTKYYPDAVRKTANLFCDPQNPIADDSTSLYWYHVYLALPVSDQEKENTKVCISLLERIRSLREELQKLRDVDVQMNKKEIK